MYSQLSVCSSKVTVVFSLIKNERVDAPFTGDVKDDTGVNHIRVHHLEGNEVGVEGLADENAVCGQDLAQGILDFT